ncbi:hypothetical protein M5D96_013310 [Drosophila gunungcola]|uniref:Uncharacterized protein n=1 Tax=Drosophila gunungcola TaxID=103775 RepID=A0A9Q0BJ97_9MUSC|nr:hypothetical protein M5D96_013310 [Drosophila gunungcola]
MWTYIYTFIFQIAIFKTLLKDNLPKNISKSLKGETATYSPTTSKSFDWLLLGLRIKLIRLKVCPKR